MKNQSDNMQEYSGELDDDFGVAIGGALAGLRPEPEDFAAGVRERIEQGERAIRKSGPGRVFAARWARIAAAYLPPLMIPRGVAEVGLTAGGVAVKKSLWKWIPGVLAFPLLMLAMVVASFVWGVRSTRVKDDQGTLQDLSAYQVSVFWKTHRFTSLIVVVVFLVSVRSMPYEAVALFSIVSMFALMGLIRSLASAGLASRAEVGRRCGDFLLSTVIWGYFLITQWVPTDLDAGSRLALGLMPVVGGSLCLWLGKQDVLGWSRLRNQRLLLPVLAALIAAGCFVFLMTGHTAGTRSTALGYVASGFQDREDLSREWVEVIGSYRHLSATTGPAPEPEAFKVALGTYVDQVLRGESQVSASMPGLWELSALGWLDPSAYVIFRSASREKALLERGRLSHDIRRAYMTVATLDAAGALENSDRTRIGNLILKSTDEEPGHNALEDLWVRKLLLERLGYSNETGRLAAAVEASLIATWTVNSDQDQACFSAGPDSVERDTKGVARSEHLTPTWLPATDFALRLMASYGVPACVDLTLLACYLREHARHERLSADASNALAAAMLERVYDLDRALIPSEPSGIWAAIAQARVLLAVALLVSFCVIMTSRAPDSLEAEC
ncbi:MAG: hypothetical protein ACI9F9_000568 [Candidatus Paceibacteria bacterium]|jgi:hypothetical protein